MLSRVRLEMSSHRQRNMWVAFERKVEWHEQKENTVASGNIARYKEGWDERELLTPEWKQTNQKIVGFVDPMLVCDWSGTCGGHMSRAGHTLHCSSPALKDSQSETSKNHWSIKGRGSGVLNLLRANWDLPRRNTWLNTMGIQHQSKHLRAEAKASEILCVAQCS